MERSVGRLQLRMFQILTVETPVRFGFARAGWTPSTGSPDLSGPSDPPTDQTVVAAQASALFASRTARALVIDRSYRLSQGLVFLTNSVRYIRPLNDGSSPQAQPMWIERGIALAIQTTRRELRRAF